MPPPLFGLFGLPTSHLAALWPVVLPLLAGALAIYFLLPTPQAVPALRGALLGLIALVLAGFLLVRVGRFTPETFLFYCFSAAAVASGALLVTQHNPARAALSFALVVLSTCGLFLLLAAPFLMAATVIIYAGAIVVTFLFVLMLAQQEGPSDADARSREPLLSTITGFVLLGALLYVLELTYGTGPANQSIARIDDLLGQTRQAEGQARNAADKDLLELFRVVQEGRNLLAKYREVLQAGADRDLAARLDAISGDWTDPPTYQEFDSARDEQDLSKKVADWTREHRDEVARETEDYREVVKEKVGPALEKLQAEGDSAKVRVVRDLGVLRPHGNSPLSAWSGPPANTPPDELRRDEQTAMPQLPHDNSAYLGRSLFTDYLLPVELGGTLLLVATVGAIAIAQRRSKTERLS